MIICRFIATLFFTFCVFLAPAQEFGGNPPSLKWRQLNTDTVRVIFPFGLERQARDIAGIVQQLAVSTLSTIGQSQKKINIVLQNQTTNANGYVSLGPFRSEFFLTPRQNSFELGSLPWHKTLALHEYRHVQQFNNFRKGLSAVFYVIFGEGGQALANSTAIPDWFWEGDAVYQETLMSRQGRGRLPYFYNDYRSLWAADKNYTWMKLRNGSLRDATPDHYRLGYMLVAYGREKFGSEVWKKVTDDAARYKGLFYPFQKAVRRYTGEDFKSFTVNTFKYFRDQSPVNPGNDAAASYGKRNKHFVADEEFPQWINDSSLVYIKSSFDQPPTFFIRNTRTQKEKKIMVKDISLNHYFSCRNGRIVYSGYEPDLRWGWKDYGLIRTIDLKSGKRTRFPGKGKYLSPDIAEDGKRIVAVLSDPSGKSELHILDAVSGKRLVIIPNPDSLFYTYPKFFDADYVVAAVRNLQGEMALGKFNIISGQVNWLTPFSLRVIAFPQVFKDTVCFSMSAGSLDKLYAVAGKDVMRFDPRMDNGFAGNYQLSFNGNQAGWTSATAVGYHISVDDRRDYEFVPVDLANPSLKSDPFAFTTNSGNNDFLNRASATLPAATKYSQSFRLFNFHSWRPYISDPEYSYSLISENILNTLQSELYGTYNRNEKYKEIGASVAYGALFPVLRASGTFTFDRSFRDSSTIVHWNEVNAGVAVSLPLSFTRGRYYRNLSLSAGLNTKQTLFTGASKALYRDQQFYFGDFSVSASNQAQKARKQIYPSYAQTLLIRYRSILNNYSGYQFIANGALYFPGLFNTHSFVIQGAYQFRDTLQQYNFSNGFPDARGYASLDFPRMWKLGFNYHFPVAYPDWGFGNIAYFLRVRANAFFDYSRTKSLRSGRQNTFRTAGTEIYFDSRWWNQLPVSFGFRYSRLLDADLTGRSANQWEFILPVNLLAR